MNVTKETYGKMSKQAIPRSPVGLDCLKAFVAGGLLCAIGQAISDLARQNGVAEEDAGLCGSLALIALSVALTGFHVYDNVAKHAGAGTLVPITGFANSIASAAVEFKSEGLVLGLGAKIFQIAGPVILYGTLASVVYGVVLWVMTLL